MRDDVCIVLNDSEAAKRQLATELLEHLTLRRIAAHKLSPSPKLSEIILERAPKVIVLDYLIGNITTALDLLTQLRSKQDGYQPEVVLWTDEPSVSVAVSAMKLGAHDFVELRSSNSLERVILAIESALKVGGPEKSNPRAGSGNTYDSVIAQSKILQRCLDLARSAGSRNAPVTVLLGQMGSGKSTIGRVLHDSRPLGGSLVELDIDCWPGEVSLLVGEAKKRRIVPLLSHAATVILDHAEFDTGEIIESVVESRKRIWNAEDPQANPALVVATSSAEIARSWQRLIDAEVIEIPALADRPEDISPLIQHFLHQHRGTLGNNKIKFSAPFINKVRALEWRHNVRQLRAAVVEAFSLLDHQAEEREGDANSGLTKEELSIFQRVDQARAQYERLALLEPFIPEPLQARVYLDRCLGNLRIAAAQLGTGVPQLRLALAPREVTQS